MDKEMRYQQGQRWEFNTDVAEFEKTLVIARIIEPHPLFFNETMYHVYVKYSLLGMKSILPDLDGVVLWLTAEGLDRSVTQIVETHVELPSWWMHGRRLAKRSDTPTGIADTVCDQVCDVLPLLFESARQAAEQERHRADTIQRHLLKFSSRTKNLAPSKSVEESWARIDSWMAEHASGYAFHLNAGASESAIARFENAIEAKLPNDLKESVRLHDGGNCQFPPRRGKLLSLDEMFFQWKMYRNSHAELDDGVDKTLRPQYIKGPIKPVFWSSKWVYITDNSGDHLILDLDPPNEGTYGQILDHNHEMGPVAVLATSWAEFLRRLVDDLESGKYVYFEKEASLELIES